jgi:hypothetical protein
MLRMLSGVSFAGAAALESVAIIFQVVKNLNKSVA